MRGSPPARGELLFVAIETEMVMPRPTHEAYARAGLRAVVRGHADLLAIASRLAVPRDSERSWLRVADTPDFDAWLISWGAESVVPPHDHGDSAAALHVVHGRLVELSREPGERGLWKRRELAAGASAGVDRGRIHQVENPGPGTALSVHVYAPPLAALGYHPQLDAATVA